MTDEAVAFYRACDGEDPPTDRLSQALIRLPLSYGSAIGQLEAELAAAKEELREKDVRIRLLATSLGRALVRASSAERRLYSRLLELAWPAACGGLVGGFVAVLLLWAAGI